MTHRENLNSQVNTEAENEINRHNEIKMAAEEEKQHPLKWLFQSQVLMNCHGLTQLVRKGFFTHYSCQGTGLES